MAAGGPAVNRAEQQTLILCPCARLCPGFASEAFFPPPKALGERNRINMWGGSGGGSASPGRQREEGRTNHATGIASRRALGKLKCISMLRNRRHRKKKAQVV